MGIGNNIKKILNEKNMNISELSRLSGVSAQTIYAIIKRDNQTVKPDILNKLASALNVNVDELMTIELNLDKIYDMIQTKLSNEVDNEDRDTNKVKEDSKIKRFEILNKYYDKLNLMGQIEAIKRVEELTLLDKYVTNDYKSYNLKNLPMTKSPETKHTIKINRKPHK